MLHCTQNSKLYFALYYTQMPKWLAEVHLFLPSSSILWLNIILYNIPYTVDLTVHCTVQYYLYCTVHYTLHCTLSLLYKDIKVAG